MNVQKVEKCINKIHTRRSTKTHTIEGKHTSRKSNTPQYLIHERKDRCAPKKTKNNRENTTMIQVKDTKQSTVKNSRKDNVYAV